MRYQPSANIADFLSPSLGIGEVFGQGQVENAKDFAQAVNDTANTHRAGMLGEATIASAEKMGEAAVSAAGSQAMASIVSGAASGVTRMAGSIFSPSGAGGGGNNFIPGVEGQDSTTNYSFNAPASQYAPGTISSPGWSWKDL